MFGGMVGAEIKNHEQCYLQYYTFVVQSRGYSINKIDSQNVTRMLRYKTKTKLK